MLEFLFNLIKEETPTQVFSCEFCKILGLQKVFQTERNKCFTTDASKVIFGIFVRKLDFIFVHYFYLLREI